MPLGFNTVHKSSFHRSRSSALLTLGAMAAAFSVQAENEIQADSQQDTLDEIVVVANRAERSIRDVAAHVTVITRAELANNHVDSLANVFRYIPGIDSESAGARFGNEGLSIRGIGGNRVAVLIDGIPLNDQFDVGSFSNATRDFANAGLIDRVEVLRGPASALYGSNAIGGVVAVSTLDPASVVDAGQRFGGRVSTAARTADESLRHTAIVGLDQPGFAALAGVAYTNGREQASAAIDNSADLRAYDQQSALLKLSSRRDDAYNWHLTWLRQAADVRSDLNSLLGTGRYRSTTALEGDDDYETTLLSAVLELGQGNVLRAYRQSQRTTQSTLDERALARTPTSIDRYFQFDQDVDGVELNLQRTFSSSRFEHKLGIGLEFRQKTTEEFRDGLATNLQDGTQTSTLLGEVFPLRDFPLSRSREYGAYLEDSVSFDRWTLIAALRADRFELSPKDDPIYAEDYPFASPVSVSESDLSPKFGAIFHINDQSDIYLQYAHGFRAPPFEDANIGLEIPFFNYRAVPNPDLRSESSNGFEVGFRWGESRTQLRIAAFHTRYTDFIESRVRIGTDPESGRILFQSQNLDKATISGVEMSVDHAFAGRLEGLSASASLHMANGENDVSGQPLNSVGPRQAIIGLSWLSADEARSLRLQGTFNAGWDDRDETRAALFKPPGHSIVDLYASQRIGNNVTLRAGLLNIADRTAWNWSSVRGLAEDDPTIPYLAYPGRSVSASVTIDW